MKNNKGHLYILAAILLNLFVAILNGFLYVMTHNMLHLIFVSIAGALMGYMLVMWFFTWLRGR